VKRALLAAGLTIAVLAVVYAFLATRRERMYRDFVTDGEAALAQQDTAAAVEAFSVAIWLKPDAMLGFLKRGDAYRQQGDLDAALKDLSQAARLDPAAPRALELLGDVHFAKARFDRAIEHFKAHVALDDRSPRVLYKLALAHQSAGQPAPAIEALKRALAVQPDFAEAHYLQGLCARDLQMPDEARRALERAIDIAPGLLQAREELAELHRRAGRSTQRIAELDALVNMDPTPRRYSALALAHAAAGRQDRAIATLHAAARRHPDDGHVDLALGKIWLEAVRGPESGVELEKALEALERAAGHQDSSEALALLGRTLLLSSEQKLAEQLLQRATERLPVEPTAFLYLADAAERNGRFERARRALIDYRSLAGADMHTPRDEKICQRIADLSMRLNDPATAATWYRRAMDDDEPSPALMTRLARAQWKAGDVAGARATIDDLLRRDPAHAAARALQRRIGGNAQRPTPNF
jgi:tetratricopeptide (TPR) repeat protein